MPARDAGFTSVDVFSPLPLLHAAKIADIAAIVVMLILFMIMSILFIFADAKV